MVNFFFDLVNDFIIVNGNKFLFKVLIFSRGIVGYSILKVGLFNFCMICDIGKIFLNLESYFFY